MQAFRLNSTGDVLRGEQQQERGKGLFRDKSGNRMDID